MKMKIFMSVLLIMFLNFNIFKSESTIHSDLKKDLEEIQVIKKRSKLVACMSLIRNSLAEGNNDIKQALDNTSFDRNKSFDKIIASIISNCENNIKDAEMEKTLNAENILNPISLDSNLQRLIKFDKNILKDGINFSDSELNILKEINDSTQSLDTDMTLQDEEIGFMGFKLSKMGNVGSFFIILGLVLTFVIIFGGLYQLKCKKKENKKKKQK
jgi:hypothetical protein